MAQQTIMSPVRRYGLVVVLVLFLGAVIYVQRHPPAISAIPLPDVAGGVPIVSGETVGSHIDAVSVGEAVQNVVDAPTPHVTVRAGQSVSVLGWAIDVHRSRVAAGVAAIVDGKIRLIGTYGGPRTDVAEALNNPEFTQSAFSIVVPANALTFGKHSFQLFILSADRSTFYRVSTPLTIESRR